MRGDAQSHGNFATGAEPHLVALVRQRAKGFTATTCAPQEPLSPMRSIFLWFCAIADFVTAVTALGAVSPASSHFVLGSRVSK
jgi:hypothetical protein